MHLNIQGLYHFSYLGFHAVNATPYSLPLSLPLLSLLCYSLHILSIFPLVHQSILCSVGGADYGSVRIGAFMGRKMIKSMASEHLSSTMSKSNSSERIDAMDSNESEDNCVELSETEASLDYLCNLSPYR